MRGLILLAILGMPTSLAAQDFPLPDHSATEWRTPAPSSGASAKCYDPNLHMADRSADRPDSEARKGKRLGDLPSGTLYLTVVRDVGGCSEPVVIRYGYGAAKSAAMPKRPTRHRR